MSIQSKRVWLNGNMVDYDKAVIHFLNPSMHYGVGVFEGIRAYRTLRGPAVFRLHDHMRRFLESAKILGVHEPGFKVQELVEGVLAVVRENGFEECYIRPIMYFDGESMGLNLDRYRVNIGIAAWEWNNYLGKESWDYGVRACTSTFTRLHPNASMTKAKISGNYANSILAKTEASRLGFDEAIMLDPEGYISECSGENIFLVTRGMLVAASNTSTLDGITRDTILTLARDGKIPLSDAKISRDQLYIADEVFICGTAAEVIAVREIDFRQVGVGAAGPITRTLQREYARAVQGDHARSPSWLSYLT